MTARPHAAPPAPGDARPKTSRFTAKDARDLAGGIGFLLPNILGFLAFTLVPLVISLYMAFTDWNLELHNQFRDNTLRFVGFDNFRKLLNEPDFYKYLGNTLFLMIGLPFGMAGSLIGALLLNQDFKVGGRRGMWAMSIAGAGIVGGALVLTAVGLYGFALAFIAASLFATIWVVGTTGGQSVYRTLFYFPHFTAGVATYLLWKRMYSPQNGPINNALQPLLTKVAHGVQASGLTPRTAFVVFGVGFAALWIALLAWRAALAIRRWRIGDAGTLSFGVGMLFLLAPMAAAWSWTPMAKTHPWTNALPWIAVLAAALATAAMAAAGRAQRCAPDYGMTQTTLFNGGFMCLGFLLLGLSGVGAALPDMAVATAELGIEAPHWLASSSWAKPAIILMGLWSAFGSNNMLLYLAGLSGVSQELYEAADLDGATKWQRFWNVTWPQLSNVTFFIFVMSVIGGLQGGFEMARAMTSGGPDGATTTLSYYIYTEGFSTGRLGYASAVSWALFALVMTVTLFNWKFGSRYTND